jgi:hypothetical protein
MGLATKKNKNTANNSTQVKQKLIQQINLLKSRISDLTEEIKDDKEKARSFLKEDKKSDTLIQINKYKAKEAEIKKLEAMIETLRNIVIDILKKEKNLMKGGDRFNINKLKRNLKLSNSATIEEVADKLVKKIQEDFKKMKNLTELGEKRNYKNLSDNNIKDLELELDLLELEEL